MDLSPRERLTPTIPANYRRLDLSRLYVRHPGYDDADNTLISFTPTDGSPDAPGVQYSLVHSVCAILAANRFDGWLSRSRAGDTEVKPDDNYGILPAEDYFFHVSNTAHVDTAYPIVPNFREWTFPQDPSLRQAMLPQCWSAPAINPTQYLDNVKARDGSCRLTGCTVSTEIAHIIPTAEKQWASNNSMETYRLPTTSSTKDVVGSTENMLLLRADVHDQWDKRMFSVLPSRGNEGSWTWAIHVNVPLQELHHLYHNRELHAFSGVQREFLFARMAWDFFPEILAFLLKSKPRWLRLQDGTVRECGPAECRKFCEGQGQNRSASPLKRARLVEGNAANDRMSFDSAVYLPNDAESSKTENPSQSEAETWECGDDGVYGCVRRLRAQVTEDCLADPDPCGLKRRRIVEEVEGEEDDCRGRKRSR